ncbi:hypothetical protein [Granulicoccus sp. GXG6511]|uniref:hypothetical protein n=1 Tax=Granulicoccus sp. GXG6511 TaxID=3381351 RepID=UPI003D7E6352
MSNAEVLEEQPLYEQVTAPLAVARKHWVRTTIITLVGGLLGGLIGLVLPPSYTAETRVAVGAGDLTSAAIAGFPTAADNLASNYARYVNNTGVAANTVAPGVTLKASQIPDSNVIRIEAESRDSEEAKAGATAAANDLIDKVSNDSQNQQLQETNTKLDEASAAYGTAYSEFQAAQNDLTRLQSPPVAPAGQINEARDRLARAKTAEGVAQARLSGYQVKLTRLISEQSRAAQLIVVREVGDPKSSRGTRMQQLGLLGLVGGFIVALIAARAAERRADDEATEV